MTVRLRAHHLLCVLTYVGKGYNPDFVANLNRIAARLGNGEDVLIVEGPDDICAPLLEGGDGHCLTDRVRWRDRIAQAEVASALESEVVAGEKMTLGAAQLAQLRASYAAEQVRGACVGCQWKQLCASVAANGYRDTRLRARSSTPAEGGET
ncbi:DUF1284 domain-containing protein [Tateyamaria omphalii]|uniref:DUF1284 domain-containing protein n=1 Tax=Tateyamaria omphalii TaxID=299262 RepID=UPI001C99920C|nr:DUF1284 domain-containing protein [Tateyamaria omphalii]MBY5933298.1 DUF1284 domain-containing protein [Tateyamaria omphalii]